MTNPKDPFDETLLTAFLDNELTSSDRSFVSSRLENSAELQKLLQEMQSIRKLVSNLQSIRTSRSSLDGPWNGQAPHSVVDSSTPEHVTSIAKPQWKHQVKTRSVSWHWIASLAAVFLIGVTGCLLFFNRFEKQFATLSRNVPNNPLNQKPKSFSTEEFSNGSIAESNLEALDRYQDSPKAVELTEESSTGIAENSLSREMAEIDRSTGFGLGLPDSSSGLATDLLFGDKGENAPSPRSMERKVGEWKSELYESGAKPLQLATRIEDWLENIETEYAIDGFVTLPQNSKIPNQLPSQAGVQYLFVPSQAPPFASFGFVTNQSVVQQQLQLNQVAKMETFDQAVEQPGSHAKVIEFQILKSEWMLGASKLQTLGVLVPTALPNNDTLNFVATATTLRQSSVESNNENTEDLGGKVAKSKKTARQQRQWLIEQTKAEVSNEKQVADSNAAASDSFSAISKDIIRVRITVVP